MTTTGRKRIPPHKGVRRASGTPAARGAWVGAWLVTHPERPTTARDLYRAAYGERHPHRDSVRVLSRLLHQILKDAGVQALMGGRLQYDQRREWWTWQPGTHPLKAHAMIDDVLPGQLSIDDLPRFCSKCGYDLYVTRTRTDCPRCRIRNGECPNVNSEDILCAAPLTAAGHCVKCRRTWEVDDEGHVVEEWPALDSMPTIDNASTNPETPSAPHVEFATPTDSGTSGPPTRSRKGGRRVSDLQPSPPPVDAPFDIEGDPAIWWYCSRCRTNAAG